MKKSPKYTSMKLGRAQNLINRFGFVTLAGFAMSSLHLSGAIFANDLILVDFTLTTNTTGASEDADGTWNNVSPVSGNIWGGTNDYDGIIASNLVRYTDGTATGVSLNVSTASGSNAGIGGLTPPSDNSALFSQTGLIPLSAQSDTSFQVNGVVSYILSGLDDSLTYTLEFQSWTSDTARNSISWIVQDGFASEASISVDPNDTPSVYTFTNVSTDGSGNISLSSDSSGGGPNATHLNALQLTAVPEPSTFAALFGVVALVMVWQRRRRN